MAKYQSKKRAMAVGLCKSGKNLRFNAAVSRRLSSWSEVDVLEKGPTVAVQSAHSGHYHIYREQGRSRIILSNRELVEYLCLKFQCEPGDTLPAWAGDEENVIFFGGMQDTKKAACTLDESWTRLELDYNRRAGDWVYVHDDWIEFSQEVREALPASMSAFLCGGAVALMADSRGALKPEPRRQKQNNMLVSHALAQELRARFNGVPKGMRLRAALIPGGILIAEDEESLSRADRNSMEPLPLGEAVKRYIRLQQDGGIYLSSGAKKALGTPERVEIHRCADAWIISGEKKNGLRICTNGCANNIFSKPLVENLLATWPAAKRLYLLERDGAFVLWPEISFPEKPVENRRGKERHAEPPRHLSDRRDLRGKAISPSWR